MSSNEPSGFVFSSCESKAPVSASILSVASQQGHTTVNRSELAIAKANNTARAAIRPIGGPYHLVVSTSFRLERQRPRLHFSKQGTVALQSEVAALSRRRECLQTKQDHLSSGMYLSTQLRYMFSGLAVDYRALV